MTKRSPKLQAKIEEKSKITDVQQFDLITDSKKLKAKITAVNKTGKVYHVALHVCAVSALHHTLVHRDPTLLNKFYEGLSTAYKTSFKLYITRISKDDEVLNEFIKTKTVNGQQSFVVQDMQKMTDDQKKVAKRTEAIVADLCERRLISPDGVRDKEFFERNPLVEQKLMTDETIAKQLKQMLSSASGNSERVNADVCPATIEAIEKTLKLVEHNAEVIAEARKKSSVVAAVEHATA